MSPILHRGLILDQVPTIIPGHPVFVCVGVHGCGCLVLDVEQHADWHRRCARPSTAPLDRLIVEASGRSEG